MEQTQTIVIDRLPTRTWNRLKVNEAVLPWDTAGSVDLGTDAYDAVQHPALCLTVGGQGDYSHRTVRLSAPEGTAMTAIECYENTGNLSVETVLEIGKNARIRLIQVQLSKPGTILRTAVTGTCAEGGKAELIQIFPGNGDVYADSRVDLTGDGSALQADIGYLGQSSQTVDLNLAVNHFGKKTESEISAAGALKDGAQKVFRGTIDFKTGSAGSVGSEQETVLMLGKDAVNKTVPLILCAEENVEGTHGATIGELDEQTLFYFESRGFDRQTAENMMARAALERLARMIDDPQTREKIFKAIGGQDDDEL